MKYKQLYYRLIESFKQQEIPEDTYTEKHHIIPKHQGGDNSRDNLIRVTLRQHIFLHKLLWKAYGNIGDKIAYLYRRGDTEEARCLLVERLREMRTGSTHSEDMKLRLKEIHSERMKIPEQRAIIINAQRISADNCTKRAAQKSRDLIDNAERNEEWLVKKSSRSIYKFESPEGLVFDSPIYAAKYYGNGSKPMDIENWCKRSKYGWKTIPELAKK